MNDYEARLAERKARLEDAAARAEREASASVDRARSYTAGIPFGQPILVGHHSEGRHRAALKRSDNAMRRASELYDKAKDLAAKAAGVGTGGISRQDPDAATKLREKVAELEAERDAMKAANAYYRKHKTLEGWDGPAATREAGESNMRCWVGVYAAPFPSYALSNLGANIRTTKARLVEVERLAAEVATAERTVEEIGAGVVEDLPDEHRVMVSWTKRLSKEDYNRVRGAGFVWSPRRGGFVRIRSARALQLARELATIINPEG